MLNKIEREFKYDYYYTLIVDRIITFIYPHEKHLTNKHKKQKKLNPKKHDKQRSFEDE